VILQPAYTSMWSGGEPLDDIWWDEDKARAVYEQPGGPGGMMAIDGSRMTGNEIYYWHCRWELSFGPTGASAQWRDEYGTQLRSSYYKTIDGRWFLSSVSDWTYPPNPPPVRSLGRTHWDQDQFDTYQRLLFEPDGRITIHARAAGDRTLHVGRSTGNTMTSLWMDIPGFKQWDDMLNPANGLWADDPALDRGLARYWELEPAPTTSTNSWQDVRDQLGPAGQMRQAPPGSAAHGQP